MKRSISALALATACWTVAAGGATTARAQTTLVSDDFNDAFLDFVLWRADTAPVFPFFARQVFESGGVVTIMNAGYLVTMGQYDPVALEGLRVSGEWMPLLPNDVLNVATRSNAVASTAGLNVSQGIVCRVKVGFLGNQIAIDRVEGGLSATLASTFVPINTGEKFAFEIVDDGANVTFKITEIGGDATTAQITAAVNVDNPGDYIVFHNVANTGFAQLDNVLIESLADPVPDPDPEPEPPTAEEIIVGTADVVIAMALPKGTTNALTEKLSTSLGALALGDTDEALGSLKAFTNYVKAQTGKKISTQDATTLLEAAEAIRALILAEE